MKTKIFIVLLLLISFVIKSQSVAEDSKGNTSILLPMGSISFNSSDTRLKANYSSGFPSPEKFLIGRLPANRYTDYSLSGWDSVLIQSKRINRFLFGVGAEGANSDGTAALFDGGHFTPESKIYGSIGLKWYNSKNNLFKIGRRSFVLVDTLKSNAQLIKDNKEKISNIIYNIDFFFKDTIVGRVSKAFEAVKAERAKDSAKIDKERLKALIADSTKLSLISKNFQSLKIQVDNDSLLLAALDALKRIYDSDSDYFNQFYNKFDKSDFFNPYKNNGLVETINTNNVLAGTDKKHDNELDSLLALIPDKFKKNRLLFALFFTLQRDARKFTLYDPSQIRLKDQYSKISYDGNTASVNLNIFWNDHSIFGLSFGIQNTDNYEDLDSFTTESTTNFTDSNRVDKQVESLKGKKGTYIAYQQYPVMIDYIGLIRTENEVIAINPYFRAYILAKKSDIVHTKYKYGLSCSIFKRKDAKFSFGVYAELNNPPEADDKRSWEKRVAVGIITKLNLIPMKLERINNYQ